VKDADVATMTGAIASQILSDVAPTWERAPVAVTFYADSTAVPAMARVIAIVDTIDNQPTGVLGFHDANQAGQTWGLVAAQPDVLMTSVGSGLAPLLQATKTIPIVFTSVVDPVGSGLVESLARPGGNASGFSSFEWNVSGKWLDLLRQMVPRLTRVAVVRDPTIGGGGQPSAWIGDACASDPLCDYPGGICIRDDRAPGGLCTFDCSKQDCPNDPDHPLSFCANFNSGTTSTGRCLIVCNPNAPACRQGYKCVEGVAKFGDPSKSAAVCSRCCETSRR